MQVTAIIPTLNAAASLPGALAALAPASAIIVVDGGSQDASVAIAERFGATIVRSARGRGIQLAAGAAAATNEWMLFVHADTLLAPGWLAAAESFARASAEGGQAGAFRFALDDGAWQARALERLVAFRSKVFALPYGDQGLLIHRRLYDAVGGFRTIPIMEDIDLARRLGRARMRMIEHSAVTSAARWRRSGWLRQSLRNQYCLALYFAGVAPERIRAIYER